MAGEHTIWHNPRCTTSRFVLQALHDAGLTPVVRDYQDQPPSEAELAAALIVLDMRPRGLLRRRSPDCDRLGLADETITDEALISLMAENPAVIERPVVFGPTGGCLCRPKEKIFDWLAGVKP